MIVMYTAIPTLQGLAALHLARGEAHCGEARTDAIRLHWRHRVRMSNSCECATFGREPGRMNNMS